MTIIAIGASKASPECSVCSGASDKGIHGSGPSPSTVSPVATSPRPGRIIHKAGGSGIDWMTNKTAKAPHRISKLRSAGRRSVCRAGAQSIVAASATIAAICSTASPALPAALDPPSRIANARNAQATPACASACGPRRSSDGMIASGRLRLI